MFSLFNEMQDAFRTSLHARCNRPVSCSDGKSREAALCCFIS